MELAQSVCRLYKKFHSGEEELGDCDAGCPFARDGIMCYCKTHNRFINMETHCVECNSACSFVRIERGLNVCILSGRMYDYELSDEGRHKYEACTGVENMNCVRNEGEKVIKRTRFYAEASGADNERLKLIRDRLFEIATVVIDSLSTSIPSSVRHDMAHAACHSYCLTRSHELFTLRFPFKTFVAVFLVVCLRDPIRIKGAISWNVVYPDQFKHATHWAKIIQEGRTRSITTKELLLRNMARSRPEIVSLSQYNPFIIPVMAIQWDDILTIKF